MRTRSLRWRLALTYAGMALLTAVILGGILIAVLANHYTNAEDDYLTASAKLIVADPPPLTTVPELTSWAQAAALTTQTRVQVYSSDGSLVVDSGSPSSLDADALIGGPTGRGTGTATTTATSCPTRSATGCSAAAAPRAPAAR